MLRQGGNQQQPQQQPQQQLSNQQSFQNQHQTAQPPTTSTTSTMGGLFSSLTGSQQTNQQQPQTAFASQNQQYQPQNQQYQAQNQNRMQHKGVPQVVPNVMVGGASTVQQPNAAGAPNLMQKLNEITAPGGDILSKGKELIFMKFGLGGK